MLDVVLTTPLLKIVAFTAFLLSLAVVLPMVESGVRADDAGIEVDTVTVGNMANSGSLAMDATLRSPTGEVSSTVGAAPTQSQAAATSISGIDLSEFLVLILGLVGLIWVRKHVQSL